jgi:hypothetical protein
MTKKVVHQLSFEGALLKRGFWLYVWEITTPDGAKLYYVGRTGDSSSINAQSPFNRMGQHLGFNDRANVLRRRLMRQNVNPEACSFRLVAYGPILGEADIQKLHRTRRDMTASLEKALADAMGEAGYTVINSVDCRIPVAAKVFASVRAAFTAYFPLLRGRDLRIE